MPATSEIGSWTGISFKGGWTLHRTSAGAKPQWLMIKRRDAKAGGARDLEASEPRSVKSGRTIDELARDGE